MRERELEFVPGARVTLTGLKSNASLNGKCAVIQPKEEWPPHDSRIAVRLEGGDTDMRIAIKPQNLVLATEEATSACCLICLEEATGPTAAPLLQTGCGCRGTAGHVHTLCAIRAAAAEHERAGTWAGKHPWQLCATCKLPFTGALKLALAQEWCRRTEPLARTDVQLSSSVERFAARTTLSNALSAAGRLAEAETVVRDNLETATALHGAEHRHTLGTTLNLGLLLDGQGKHKEAAHVYADLLRAQERVLGAEHRDTLNTAMQLAGASLNQGRNAEAESQYRQVLATQQRVLGETDPATLTCSMNLASALLNLGRLFEAEGMYRANLAAKLRKLGPEHVDTLMAGMNLGTALKEVGRYDEAEKVLRANHRTKERVLGATHADTCFAMLNLVAVWVDGEPGGGLGEATERGRCKGNPNPRNDRHMEAEGIARAAVAALSASFGEEHPSVLSAQVHVGMVLAASGRAEEAVELLRKVHAAQLKAHHGEESHPDALETAWRLGCALLAAPVAASAGTPPPPPPPEETEALARLRATARLLTEQLGTEHPRTLRCLVSVAAALLAAGGAARAAEAEALARKCVALQRRLLDPRHADIRSAERALRMATLAVADGDTAELVGRVESL